VRIGAAGSCHFRTHAVQQMKTLFGFAVGTVVYVQLDPVLR
jgi:hypothetical protein